MRAHAAGYLWLGILFSSVLSLGESFRIESKRTSALDGIKLAPTDARAIFLGKALGNTLMLWLLGVGVVTGDAGASSMSGSALGLPKLIAVLGDRLRSRSALPAPSTPRSPPTPEPATCCCRCCCFPF